MSATISAMGAARTPELDLPGLHVQPVPVEPPLAVPPIQPSYRTTAPISRSWGNRKTSVGHTANFGTHTRERRLVAFVVDRRAVGS